MSRILALCGILLAFSSLSAFAQHAVDPAQRYHRLICLVHLTGSGKQRDEIRAEYVPAAMDATSRAGVIARSVNFVYDSQNWDRR